MKFYYGIGNKKVIASPLNWGEKDPIAEFAKQLRGTNDKENWRLAKKLDPKVRIFAPVIVRGQESEGVHLWEFVSKILGKTVSPSVPSIWRFGLPNTIKCFWKPFPLRALISLASTTSQPSFSMSSITRSVEMYE